MDIVWKIDAMGVNPQVEGLTDVVVTAQWRCIASQDEYNSQAHGTATFTITQGAGFTPFNELTETQVLGWCWASGVDQVEIEAAVTAQTETQINPPIVTPVLPWAQTN